MPTPFQQTATVLDLNPRVFKTTTVAASPSAATETIVGSLTISGDLACTAGVLLVGYGAFTVGTNGVSVNLKIRRTDASGSTIGATGAVTYTAADLGALTAVAFDTLKDVNGQVYVLTATVASANAASTFSAVTLVAIPI